VNPDRFARLKELLLRAADLSGKERRVFIDDACKDDPLLRREVEAVLAYEKDTHSILRDDSLLRRALHTAAKPLDLTGQEISHYQILALIGEGGMGQVYRARDTRLGRDVALKVISPTLSADAERIRRFEQEARAAGSLNHPNIVAIHDIGVHENAPFVVMELLEGESLRQRLSQGPVPIRKAIDYAVQAARGLAAAHEKGIVHRDIKPENLFVTKDGRVKILDFGVAKLTRTDIVETPDETTSADSLTGTGVIIGTSGYMSPEQAQGRPADHRSDIFALGATLYEMLTGKRTFQKGSFIETLHAIVNEDPPLMSASGREIPSGLEAIVRHCLEKSPQERFQSASDFSFALESLSGSSLRSGEMIAPAPRGRKIPHMRLLVGASLVVVVIAAAIAGVMIGSRTADRNAPDLRDFCSLTYQPLIISNARYAPDGRTVVFSAARQGSIPEIYTIAPEYPEPRPAGMTQTHLLSVSSNGELAVLTNPEWMFQRVYEGTLSVVPLGGTAPRPLIEKVRDADWSPDGSQMAIIRSVEGVDQLEFPIGSVLYKASGYLSDLRISPKGDRIACFIHPARWDDRGAVLLVDRAGKHKILTEEYAGLEGLAWSPDEKRILFSGSPTGGSYQICVADPTGGAAVALHTPESVVLYDMRPDGQWLLATYDAGYRIDVYTSRDEVDQDLSWLGQSEPACLSADGRLLLFTEETAVTGFNYAVCVRRTDGSPVVRLGEGKGQDLSPHQSQAVALIWAGPPKVVIYPLGPGESKALNTDGLTTIQHVWWSSDGAHLFALASESGHSLRIYKLGLSPDRPQAITPEGGVVLAESADGSVVVRDIAGNVVLIRPGEATPLAVMGWRATDSGTRHWSRDGESVLVWERGQLPASVEWLNLRTGKRTPFRVIGPRDLTGVMSVAKVMVSDDESAIAGWVWKRRDFLFTADCER